MRQRLLLLLFVLFLGMVLVGLDAASYSQKQRPPENEYEPNRSTFNPGPTGTQALFTLLAETGRRPVRWQEPPSALRSAKDSPSTFVVIGPLLRPMTKPEADDLLHWTSQGRTLVVVDREPPENLLKTTASWTLVAGKRGRTPDAFNADPSDTEQMTHGIAAVHPDQPTNLTIGVNAVQPSIFARSLEFAKATDEPQSDDTSPISPTEPVENDSISGPVAHLSSGPDALMLEAPYGEGRIIFLGDPYIVANGGISLSDNAKLAVNLMGHGEGRVAFDEYHQGFGADNHRFFQFFAGTPVVPVFLQIVFIVGAVFYSRARRFTRPLPETRPDRLSKLEYVGAMAELQNRAKAYDLALENIYNDFRRRAARHLGINAIAPTSRELSGPIAARAKLDSIEVERLLFQIEEAIRGEKTSSKETVRLVRSLRDLESALGIARVRGTER